MLNETFPIRACAVCAFGDTNPETAHCASPEAPTKRSGGPLCREARDNSSLCGPEAIWWKLKDETKNPG